MAFGVVIRRPAMVERVLLLTVVGDNVRVAPETEIASRFGLNAGEFQIFEEGGEGLSIGALSSGFGDQRIWYLKCGSSYVVTQTGGGSCSGRDGDAVQTSNATDAYVPVSESEFSSSSESENVRVPLRDGPPSVGKGTPRSVGNGRESENVGVPLRDILLSAGKGTASFETPP